MKIKVDKDSDTLYFRLDDAAVIESEEVQPGVVLDYDAKNRVVGIEFLGISSRTTPEELSVMHFQTA